MIDTLRLTRRLEAANVPREQAEAWAKILDDALNEHFHNEQRDWIHQEMERSRKFGAEQHEYIAEAEKRHQRWMKPLNECEPWQVVLGGFIIGTLIVLAELVFFAGFFRMWQHL